MDKRASTPKKSRASVRIITGPTVLFFLNRWLFFRRRVIGKNVCADHWSFFLWYPVSHFGWNLTLLSCRAHLFHTCLNFWFLFSILVLIAKGLGRSFLFNHLSFKLIRDYSQQYFVTLSSDAFSEYPFFLLFSLFFFSRLFLFFFPLLSFLLFSFLSFGKHNQAEHNSEVVDCFNFLLNERIPQFVNKVLLILFLLVMMLRFSMIKFIISKSFDLF